MKKQKYEINQVIKFKFLSVIAGKFIDLSGTVYGHGPEIRKRWPCEAGECPDHFLLVRTVDVFGNDYWHIVDPDNEVIGEAK
jgi:hypothetical protein